MYYKHLIHLALMIIFTIKVIFLNYRILMFFSLLDIRKRNKRSYCRYKNRNLNCKNRHTLTLSDLSIILKQSGHYMALSPLFTRSFASLRNLDIEDNKFYDRTHRLT